MINLTKTALLVTILALSFSTPTLAKGLIMVEDPEGNYNDYEDIGISSNKDILNVDDGTEGNIIEIIKKDCTKEGEITVCTNGTVLLNTYGVKEAIEVKQMVVFTNLTNKPQPIKDSKVILSPQSVMAEILTEKGTYINISGKIDSPNPRY